jgi:hypothetical protein
LSPAWSVVPSFPTFQSEAFGFWTRTLPPTIDKTVKGLKAAAFVPQETSPNNKDKNRGVKSISLRNGERTEGILQFPAISLLRQNYII